MHRLNYICWYLYNCENEQLLLSSTKLLYSGLLNINTVFKVFFSFITEGLDGVIAYMSNS